MHELAMMESILGVVDDAATKQGFQRVLKVSLEIGDLAAVDADSLHFAFTVIGPTTRAAGAVLEIVRLPGRAHCLGCGQSVVIHQRHDLCPLCGSERLLVTGGDEMRIKDLEVE